MQGVAVVDMPWWEMMEDLGCTQACMEEEQIAPWLEKEDTF
jgi:hypothetical protein